MTDLKNCHIVITRPEHQAQGLCSLIESNGGHAIKFPVLEIADPQDDTHLNQVLQQLAQFDIAIFISPNAVNKAVNLIRAKGEFPAQLKIAAVGKGSARELNNLSIEVDIVPKQRFDSEALLAMPEMQQVKGNRIVIFRGEGGRELLANCLKERGAEVEYAECYRRSKPKIDSQALLHHWARGEVDVIVVTSSEGLHNLYDLVGALGRQWLIKTPLLVVSERTAKVAEELGFKQAPIVAEQASDEGILQTLLKYCQPVA